jgi:FtsZ-interacting cell division protein ZipA
MSKGNTTSSSASETLKRRSLILALVIVLAGIIVGGLWMRKHEPNYYAPGRTPLVNAKVKLEQTLALEKAYVQERRQAHREIETAITAMESVAEVDPKDRAMVSDLLQQLKEIESVDLGSLPDDDALQAHYESVLEKIDKLIEKLGEKQP